VIYNYLKLDFYLSFAALFFLAAGIFIKEKKEIIKEVSIVVVN
jgi:hypothetical protein